MRWNELIMGLTAGWIAGFIVGATLMYRKGRSVLKSYHEETIAKIDQMLGPDWVNKLDKSV